jgi:hypothetical protein
MRSFQFTATPDRLPQTGPRRLFSQAIGEVERSLFD